MTDTALSKLIEWLNSREHHDALPYEVVDWAIMGMAQCSLPTWEDSGERDLALLYWFATEQPKELDPDTRRELFKLMGLVEYYKVSVASRSATTLQQLARYVFPFVHPRYLAEGLSSVQDGWEYITEPRFTNEELDELEAFIIESVNPLTGCALQRRVAEPLDKNLRAWKYFLWWLKERYGVEHLTDPKDMLSTP